MEYIINSLQLIGGIILSISYIFQIRQIVKTKSVKDLNEIYLILAVIGVSYMETYAIYNLIKGVAFMFFITNTIALGLGVAILVLYEIYKKDNRSILEKADFTKPKMHHNENILSKAKFINKVGDQK